MPGLSIEVPPKHSLISVIGGRYRYSGGKLFVNTEGKVKGRIMPCRPEKSSLAGTD